MPNQDTRTDEELMADFYGCNELALELIRWRYQDRIFRFFREKGVEPEGATRKTAKVFTELLNAKEPDSRATKYDPSRGAIFRTWLFGNRGKLRWILLRPDRVGPEVQTPIVKDEEGNPTAFTDLISDGSGTPLDILSAKEDLQRIKDAVHQCKEGLDDKQNEAITMWLDLGRRVKMKELAESLDCSIGKAFKVLHQATSKMRECLENKNLPKGAIS